MISYDADQLRALATRVHRRASFAVFGYALLLFAIGVPIGASAVMLFNAGRRIEIVRTREDYDALAHSEEKGEELKSLLHGTPTGALAMGVLLGAVGLAFGLSRATSLKLEAQTALCLAQIEAATRRS